MKFVFFIFQIQIYLNQIEVSVSEMRHSSSVAHLPSALISHGEEDLRGAQVVLQLSAQLLHVRPSGVVPAPVSRHALGEDVAVDEEVAAQAVEGSGSRVDLLEVVGQCSEPRHLQKM